MRFALRVAVIGTVPAEMLRYRRAAPAETGDYAEMQLLRGGYDGVKVSVHPARIAVPAAEIVRAPAAEGQADIDYTVCHDLREGVFEERLVERPEPVMGEGPEIVEAEARVSPSGKRYVPALVDMQSVMVFVHIRYLLINVFGGKDF